MIYSINPTTEEIIESFEPYPAERIQRALTVPPGIFACAQRDSSSGRTAAKCCIRCAATNGLGRDHHP